VSSPPAEASSIRRDVDAAVGQIGGDGHKLVDETCPTHQSEGADQLMVVSNYTENVTCGRNTERWVDRQRDRYKERVNAHTHRNTETLKYCYQLSPLTVLIKIHFESVLFSSNCL